MTGKAFGVYPTGWVVGSLGEQGDLVGVNGEVCCVRVTAAAHTSAYLIALIASLGNNATWNSTAVAAVVVASADVDQPLCG